MEVATYISFLILMYFRVKKKIGRGLGSISWLLADLNASLRLESKSESL